MYFIIIALVVALDQLTKYLVVAGMNLYQSIPLLEGVFHLTYIQNFGAAFSILQNKTGFLLAVTSVPIFLMVAYLFVKRKNSPLLLSLSLSLIAGGGIGNMIDRALRGYVVDFFDFRRFPVFNVGDIAVTVGCALLIFYVLYWEPRHSEQKTASAAGTDIKDETENE